jgi:FKBP12-rapamycin complex-associated protein
MSGIEPRNPSGNGVSDSHRPETFRPRNRSSAFAQTKLDEAEAKEVQNARAIQVLARVKEKLTGRDFKPGEELRVETQVDKLIREATNLENLCQHYIGWCSFW